MFLVGGVGLNSAEEFSVEGLAVKFKLNCNTGWGIGAWFNSKFMVYYMSWFIFSIHSHYKYKYTKCEVCNEYFTYISLEYAL